MNAKFTISLCLFLSFFFVNAQYVPGGVTGSEVWYIVDWDDLNNDAFTNSANSKITLNNCGSYKSSLFNFNPSISTDKLCLRYFSSLENSKGRNVFFVGEPTKPSYSYSHLGTKWRSDLSNIAETDSIIRNFFDLNTKNVYSKEILQSYLSDKNANVNFYHSNYYNIDKKFKSYGQDGETIMYIGKPTIIDPQVDYEDNYFYGNFPEFISFPRELSANERNRVESYLALKYGLTLNRPNSYLSSKNIIFWNSSNNNLFGNRIFGLGIDNISGLFQFQSESSHFKDHLIAAKDEIMSNNIEKQESVTKFHNDHFLVFGDNGKKLSLKLQNSKGLRFGEKVWLAQRTGKEIHNYSTYFKLFLPTNIINHLNENSDHTLWLMQDKFVNNDEYSDFDNENIKYYQGDIDLNEGIADYGDVYFDTDLNIYDQFTFGVGPRMIVQAQVQGCKGDRLILTLEITGGRPKYYIDVTSNSGNFSETITNNTYSFSVNSGTNYNIEVTDAQGLVVVIDYIPEPWNFNLDLGGTQYLNSNQQEITLDAGIGIDDPDASYEWYLDGNLLPDNNSTLLVNEPGEYLVIVTSADQSCSISDKVTVKNSEIEANISISQLCGSEYSNTVFINVAEGASPFVTNILEQGGYSVNYAHSGSTSFTDIPYGLYQITITDSLGNTFTESIEFLEAEEILLDLYSQLEAVCVSNNYSESCINYDYPSAPLLNWTSNDTGFTIDASLGVVNQNVHYQWYIDGQSTGSSGPILVITPGDYCNSGTGEIPMFTVVATDTIFDCVETQSFISKGFCPQENTSQPNVSNNSNQDSWLKTMVYPNPSETNKTFIYEVFAPESFNGTVELYTMSGAKLYSIQTQTSTNHKIPFRLVSAGVYLIKITTSQGVVKTDRIIIN